MGGKTILLVSDAASLYTQRLTESLLLSGEWKIIICPRFPIDPETSFWYKKRDVAIEPLFYGDEEEWKALSQLKKMQLYASRAKELAHKYHPDIVNIQAVSLYRLFFVLSRNFCKAKLVVSFWGSDLLRAKRFVREWFYPVGLKKASAITCDGLFVFEALRQLYGEKTIQKTHYIRFANPIIETICDLKKHKSKIQSRRAFSIPMDNRLVLVLGYNANPAHHHIEMTEALGKLPVSLQKCLYLVYPMTYGPKTDEYFAKLDMARGKLSCDSLVLKEFLSDEKCAELYWMADAVIHAQTTDAFSQTFVDYLYAQATVFQGRWLHYPEIDRFGYDIYEFDSYEELTEQIRQFIDNPQRYFKRQTQSVMDAIYQIESPQSNSNAWNTFFRSVLNEGAFRNETGDRR